MNRRLFMGFLIVAGILFPVSIVPERGGEGHELAGVGWSPPSREVSHENAQRNDSIPAMAKLTVTKDFGNQ